MVQLIFEIRYLNGALFLAMLLSFTAAAKRSIVPLTTIYASLYDLSIEVLNFTFLLAEYGPLHKSFTSILFLASNFDTVGSFNNLDIL